jgi:hypothetical protein
VNEKQNKCLFVGVVIFWGMVAYPPWVTYKPVSRYDKPAFGYDMYKGPLTPLVVRTNQYGFIGSPPYPSSRINFNRLVIQLVIVTAITTGLLLTFEDKKTNGKTDKPES